MPDKNSKGAPYKPDNTQPAANAIDLLNRFSRVPEDANPQDVAEVPVLKRTSIIPKPTPFSSAPSQEAVDASAKALNDSFHQVRAKRQADMQAFVKGVHNIKVRQQAEDNAYQQQAMADARATHPGVPDEQLTGFAKLRADALRSQVKAAEDAAVDGIGDDYFKTVTGLSSTGANAATLANRKDAQDGSAFASLLVGPLASRPGMDQSFVYSEDGKINKDFKKQVLKMSGGDPKKFKEAAQSIIDGKAAEYDAAPSIGAQIYQSALDYTHKVPVVGSTAYYALSGISAGAKAALRTGATLGHVLSSAYHGVAGNLEEYDRSNHYGNTLADIEAIPDKAKGEEELSWETFANNPFNAVDALLGNTARFGGEVEALGGLGRTAGAPITNTLEHAGIGTATEGLANTAANRAYPVYAKALDALGNSRIPGYLDNVLSTGAMFGSSMYGNYYAEALKRGYTPAQADEVAAKRTSLAIPLMAIGNLAGPTARAQMNKLPKEILDAMELDAPKTFFGKAQQVAGQILKATDPKEAAKGGLGMSASAFADAYQEHQEAIDKGLIDPNTPFDAKSAIEHAAQAGVIGTLTTGVMHLANGHGNLVETPQALAIYQAAQNPAEFYRAVDRQAAKSAIAPEQAEALKGYIGLITEKANGRPSLLEQGFTELGKDGKPTKNAAAAVKWATEQARLQEVAQEVGRLAQQTSVVKTVDDQGNERNITYGIDPQTGIFTEAAGVELQERMNALNEKAAASQKAISQLKEGSYVRDRTVKGDELLRITSNATPEGKLTTQQAGRILGEGPYTSDIVDITPYANDPEVKSYIDSGLGDFKTQHANDPIIGADNSIIDGRKRIAAALLNGQTALPVVRPLSMAETATHAQEARDNTLGSDAPIVEGLAPEGVEVLTQAKDAYETGLERTPTETDTQLGLSTPAVRALHDAAEVLRDAQVPKEQIQDMLNRVTGGNTDPSVAEHITNVATGTRPAEAVKEAAPQSEVEPTAEIAPQTIEEQVQNSPTILSSVLADNGRLRDDVTPEEIEDYLLMGDVPERYRSLGEENDSTFEDTPEAVALRQELQTITDEPTIQAFEQRSADEVEKSEPTVESIESKANSDGEAELAEAIEIADAFIQGNAGSQPRPGAAQGSNEPPAGGNNSPASQQAPSLSIRRGQANILVDEAQLSDAGWSEKGVRTLHARLQDMFGRAAFNGRGVTVAIIGNDGMRKLSGLPKQSTPDARYRDGIVYINVEHPAVSPSSALHESGHMWVEWSRTNATELHSKGVELAQQTPEYQYAISKLTNPKSKEAFGLDADAQRKWTRYAQSYAEHSDARLALVDEVLAQSIQQHGRNIAKGTDIRNKFTEWLQSFWDSVKGAVGFRDLNARKLADLSFEDFTKRVTEELGSGKALTRRLIEEEAIAQRPKRGERVVDKSADAVDPEMAMMLEERARSAKPKAEVDENDQEAILQQANDAVSGEGEDGGGSLQITGGSPAPIEETLSSDPLTNAMGSMGADGVLTYVERNNPEAYKEALELFPVLPENEARVELADVLSEPGSASAQIRKELGIEINRSLLKIKKGSIADRIFGDMADYLNKQKGVKSKYTGAELAKALSRHTELAQQAEAAHQANIERGKRNQVAGLETGTDESLVTELNDLIDSESLSSQSAIRRWAKEKGITEEKANDLLNMAVNRRLQDAMYSLPDDKNDRQLVHDALIAAAQNPDNNRFADQALQIVRNAFQEGYLSREEAGPLARMSDAARTPEAKAQFLRAIDALKSNEPVAEETVEPLSPTGIRNKVVDEERAKRGLSPAMKVAGKEFGRIWDEALAILDKNPNASENLLNDLRKEVKALSGVQNALLTHRQIMAQTEERGLIADVNELSRLGDILQVTAARARLADVQKDLKDIYDLGRAAGRANSEGLRTRQIMAREDYTLAAMESRQEAAQGGKPLSEQQKQEIAELHEKIATLQKQYDDYVERSERDAKKKSVVEKVAETAKEAAKRPASEKKDTSGRRLSVLDRMKQRRAGRKPSDDAMYSLPDLEADYEPVLSKEDHADIRDLMRIAAEEGITEVGPMVDRIHMDLSEFIPDLTKSEVLDAMSEYGKTTEPNKDEVAAILREIKAQGRLMAAYRDATNNKAPAKSGFQHGKPSDAVRELRKKVIAAMEEAGIDVTDPAKQLATRLEAAKNQLRNQIADLNKAILTRERPIKAAKSLELDTEGVALKAERDRLQAEFNTIFGKKELSDEKRVEMAMKAIERSIKEYERRIAEGDIAPRSKESKTPETPELIAARATRDELAKQLNDLRDPFEVAFDRYEKLVNRRKDEYEDRLRTGNFAKKPRTVIDLGDKGLKLSLELEKAKYEYEVGLEKNRLAQRTKAEKIGDEALNLLSLPKALLSTFDASAPLRQGAILSAGNPRAAGRAFVEMFRQAFSKDRAEEWLHALHGSDIYPLIRQSGLYIAEPSAKLRAREEQFMSKLPERVPIYKYIYGASERAYTGYLNKIRADVFAAGVDNLHSTGITVRTHPKEFQAWAEFINNATGRGGLGKNLELAAPILNSLMFSPRMLASRVNLMNPFKYASMPPQARIMAMRNMLSFLAVGSAVLTLAALAGADVEDDPRSADFGKIKTGDTRYDIWGGFVPIMRTIAQVVTAQRKSTTTGDIMELDGKSAFGEDRSDPVWKFLRSKLAPVPSSIVNLAKGKDVVGNEVTVGGEALKNVIPLYIQDIGTIINDPDNGGAVGIAQRAVPAFFGVGVQSYKPKE